MKKFFTLSILSLFMCMALPAQTQHNKKVMEAFSDSLKNITASYYAYYRMWEDLEVPVPRRIKPHPECYKLFVPPTYYVAPIEQAFEVHWEPDQKMMNASDSIYYVASDSIVEFEIPNMETAEKKDRWINKILLNYYLQHPGSVMGNELYYADVKAFDDSRISKVPRKETMKDYMQVEHPGKNANAEVDLLVLKPNFWRKSIDASLHFTQHAISDNWYQGGESTNAMLAEVRLESNYNDKQRVKWENSLEMKLGFITAPSDTVHKYKTNADLFRLNSKLGVQAINNWYYTLEATFKTQFFPNYKTNTNDMISNFFSPAQLDLSLGMDFKLEKSKYNLSVSAYPLSYTFVYLKDDALVNPSSFGVDSGNSIANLFGSRINANLKWQIAHNISYTGKFEFFTTYESVRISWENTVEFKLNRYLSTKMFLHPRFDDAVTLTEDNRSYFQIKEMLTFGLTYNW